MGKIYKNGIPYGSGVAGGATLEELTYEQYLANKNEYDASGNAYWISDYPNVEGGEVQTAEQTYFDDTTAQTGSNNVQGAIEAISEKSIKTTIISGTTTESGAILMPTKCVDKVIGAHYTPIDGNLKGLVFPRGDTYLTCLKLDLTPQANTEVSVKIYYE